MQLNGHTHAAQLRVAIQGKVHMTATIIYSYDTTSTHRRLSCALCYNAVASTFSSSPSCVPSRRISVGALILLLDLIIVFFVFGSRIRRGANGAIVVAVRLDGRSRQRRHLQPGVRCQHCRILTFFVIEEVLLRPEVLRLAAGRRINAKCIRLLRNDGNKQRTIVITDINMGPQRKRT